MGQRVELVVNDAALAVAERIAAERRERGNTTCTATAVLREWINAAAARKEPAAAPAEPA